MNFVRKKKKYNLFFTIAILAFDLLCGSNVNATIMVTNDWAEAVVQIREGKSGGPVLTQSMSSYAADVDISASVFGGYARAGVMHSQFPVAADTFINAYVLTDDRLHEAEAWLQMSWSFSVQTDPVDFLIDLRVEEGGDFTSTYQLYDLTTQSIVLDESLYNYGGSSKNGTLLAGHDYIFNAFLPRFDTDINHDQVADGPTILDFHGIKTDIRYLRNRTHVPLSVPEPNSFVFMGIGLCAVVIFRFTISPK